MNGYNTKKAFKGFPQEVKFQCPKFEDVMDGDVFSFTFNPNDTYQFWDDNCRTEKFHDWARTLFTNIFPKFDVHLCLEISPQGRLHYHGLIKINNRKHFYENYIFMLKEYAQVEIDTISDPAYWYWYMHKQHYDVDKITTGRQRINWFHCLRHLLVPVEEPDYDPVPDY